MKNLAALFVIFFSVCCFHAQAQAPFWVNQAVGQGEGDGHACAVAPNGNVYVAGSFTGTVDLDPSASAHNISSNGQRDIFLACYTTAGAFQWGFNVGGAENDVVENITVDNSNRAIIVGQFRGLYIDFDPGSGTKLLNGKGTDGFVAVYSANGTFAWANAIGGGTDFDDAQSATADASGNIYVGGNFHNQMEIDPNPAANTYLNSSTGTAFVIRYTSNGQLGWGINFGGGGGPGVDNTVWGIKTDNAGSLYLAGCYQGNGADFDPSGGTAILSVAGGYDGYLARYTTSGVFQYVVDIKGAGIEQAIDIALDGNSDIYLTGYTESAGIKFSPSSPTIQKPAGSDEANVFIAKYKNNGQYQWGGIAGGDETDFGWGITVANNSVYCTGYFRNTADFDISGSTATMVSKGKNDIYLARYDLNGKYICSFAVGDTSNDNARKIAADAAGNIYVCGYISPSKIDFDPNSGVVNVDNPKGADIFLTKYQWQNIPPPNGYLIGDTVCEGDEAFLRFIATAGKGPFAITITDGTNTYTRTGLESEEVFSVAQKMSKSTQYILTAIKDASLCAPFGEPGSLASIIVNPKPESNAGNDTMVCPGAVIQLHGSGDGTYRWYPPDGLSDVTIASPIATISNSTKYNLVVTNHYGCIDTDDVHVMLVPADFKVKEQNDVCIGDTIRLLASGGNTYEWSPADSLYPFNSPEPIAWPKQGRSYFVTIKDTVCHRSATLEAKVFVHQLPDVRISVARDVDCGLQYGQLGAVGAAKYTWLPVDGLDDPNAQFTYARPAQSTEYIVTGTDEWGCENTDTALIKVFEGNGRLFTPNAFTPNGDGKNDCFKVFIPGDVSGFHLTIVNRWGQAVYQSNNFDGCWNGTYNGQLAELGTYFYHYKGISSVCGELFGKGDVQLIR